MAGGRLLERVDAALGDGLENLVVAHHRRRLLRQGWLHALDAGPGGWAGGEPPPRRGNRVEMLIDGSEALPAIARACEAARSSVWLAGWHFTPELRLAGSTLRELLAEVAERAEVRVLAWAGAPLPLFHPDRSEATAWTALLILPAGGSAGMTRPRGLPARPLGTWPVTSPFAGRR